MGFPLDFRQPAVNGLGVLRGFRFLGCKFPLCRCRRGIGLFGDGLGQKLILHGSVAF